MTTAVRPETLVVSASATDTLRGSWVAEYRNQNPAADCWARGLSNQVHTIETQERVFRMAEQLSRGGVDRMDLFSRLGKADRSVAPGVDPNTPAAAGYRTIAPLVRLADEPIVIAGSGLPDLRAFGFGTIPFDGHDPAAYAWLLFELTMRARADADRPRSQCTCHPRWAPASIGLAHL